MNFHDRDDWEESGAGEKGQNLHFKKFDMPEFDKN